MAKTGCPVCGKAYGAGHWSIVDCPQVRTEIRVERVKQPELPGPQLSTLNVNAGTVHSPDAQHSGTVRADGGTVHFTSGTVHKNRKWERSHAEEYRAWRREYNRKRRAKSVST